jgi:hypothetical protein
MCIVVQINVNAKAQKKHKMVATAIPAQEAEITGTPVKYRTDAPDTVSRLYERVTDGFLFGRFPPSAT